MIANVKKLIEDWNYNKGTDYVYSYENGHKTSLVKGLEALQNQFGSEEVGKFWEASLNNEHVRDLSDVRYDYQFLGWKNNQPKDEFVPDEPKTSNIDMSSIKDEIKASVKEAMAQVQPQNTTDSLLLSLSKEMVKVMGSDLANSIQEQVEKKINAYVKDKIVTKVFEYKGEEHKVDGVAHKELENVIKFLASDEPVMLVGPAGSGKNFIAEQASKALGADFYFSNALTQEYQLMGYGDANGKYVETQFFKAWTSDKPAVFFLDELDGSSPEVAIKLNAAIANGYADFPVYGKIERNPNLRIIAAGNTWGTGASMDYVGRNQLDAATLDRFGVLYIDYDARIEESMCPDKDILAFCRKFRDICNKNGNHCIVSYREIKRMYKLIDIAGMDKPTAIKSCLLKGMQEDKDSIRMILSDMSSSLVYRAELEKCL